LNGSLTVQNSTISGNQSTGSGAGITFYTLDPCPGGACAGIANVFALYNTIIANNGANECLLLGHTGDHVSLSVNGTGNLIMSNGSGSDTVLGAFSPCPPAGAVIISDPQLQPLALNSPGNTRTMAILLSSPAAGAADSGTSLSPDQRGVTRPQNGRYDIGAYEARQPDFSFADIKPIPVDVGSSGSTAVAVNSFEYFNAPVTLAVPTPPTGVTVSFSANPITPPYNGSAASTLSVSLGPDVAAGSYTPAITGTSSPLTHSIVASIIVTPTTAGITNVIGRFLSSGAIDNYGIANALTNKLSTAQSFISAGDNQTAINVLQALLNQLNAQSGKHIAPSAASVLISDTQALQTSVGANLRADPFMGYVLTSNNAAIAGVTVNVLDSSNTVVAAATTDGSGFYFFPLTRSFTLGSAYSVKVTPPSGYKTSTPALQKVTWQATQVVLTNFVLN